MRIVSLAAAWLLGSLLWTQAASAAPITAVIDFTASDFSAIGGGGAAPVSPVTGQFTLNFDPNLDYSNSSAISANSLNINLNSGDPKFNFNSATNTLDIFTGANTSVTGGANDFLLSLTFDNSAPNPLFVFAQVGNTFSFLAGTTNVSIAVTPIPGSMVLLLTALGGFGGVAALRRRKVAETPALIAA